MHTQVIEGLIGFVIMSVLLDMLIGKKYLLSGRNQMMHPVVWTWYSTYLMLLNLVKGVIHAIGRIIFMLGALVCQVCRLKYAYVCVCVYIYIYIYIHTYIYTLHLNF